MEQERARTWFVNRLKNLILHARGFSSASFDIDSYSFGLANHLGVPYTGYIRRLDHYLPASFDDFLSAIEWLIGSLPAKQAELLSDLVGQAVADAPANLDIEWTGRHFMPEGAPILDAALGRDPLDWLREAGWQAAADAFDRSLGQLLATPRDPESGREAVGNAYQALESAARKALGNTRDLSGNRERLVAKLSLSPRVGALLAEWVRSANPYRHGSTDPIPPPTDRDAEEFVYEAGLVLRAMANAAPVLPGKSASPRQAPRQPRRPARRERAET